MVGQSWIRMLMAAALLGNTGCWSGGFEIPKDLELPSVAIVSLTSVSPTFSLLAGGGTLTLTGDEFASSMIVTVGGTVCGSLSVTTATNATCTLPALTAGLQNVVVTTADGNSASLTGAINYAVTAPAPTVSSVSPSTGFTVGGTSVTITGTGFQSGATATFAAGGCTSLTVNSATSIGCTAPANAAGAVTVTVTNSDAQSGNKPNAFTYVAAPTFTQVVAGPFASCVSCHPGTGGFSTSVYAQVSSRVTAGNPSASLIYQRLTLPGSNPLAMPPGSPMSAGDLQKVSDWITAGALNN